MQIIFSEHKSDYTNYVFPYAVWAFPDPGESPAAIMDKGFLPATPALTRYYLCRHLRIELGAFSLTSENRRVQRKCAGISCTKLAKENFSLTDARLSAFTAYADARFGAGVMTEERLRRVYDGRVLTHVLVFCDTEDNNREIGAVFMNEEQQSSAFYYYCFYDLAYFKRSMGSFMMLSAAEHYHKAGFQHLYLGTCYSKNALYKAQFKGVRFFTGFRWSDNIRELKYLIERDHQQQDCHLLEDVHYQERFLTQDSAGLQDYGQPFG